MDEAYAQIPDAGDQRIKVLNEVRRSNELLAGILETLQHGTLTVHVGEGDKPAGTQKRPVRPRTGG